jgi:hypothetical protein
VIYYNIYGAGPFRSCAGPCRSCAGLCRSLPVCAGPVPVFAGLCRSLPVVCAGLCRSVPVCAGLCRSVPVGAGRCRCRGKTERPQETLYFYFSKYSFKQKIFKKKTNFLLCPMLSERLSLILILFKFFKKFSAFKFYKYSFPKFDLI